MQSIRINDRGITLITTSRSVIAQRLPPFITKLVSKHNEVGIVDAGYNFNPYLMTDYLVSNSIDPHEILEKIIISRAFSCFQVANTLSSLTSTHSPLIVLFLMSTFDESVKMTERRKLLTRCIQALRTHTGIVLVFHHYKYPQNELFDLLKLSARSSIELDIPVPVSQPLRLFEDY